MKYKVSNTTELAPKELKPGALIFWRGGLKVHLNCKKCRCPYTFETYEYGDISSLTIVTLEPIEDVPYGRVGQAANSLVAEFKKFPQELRPYVLAELAAAVLQ